MKRKTLFIRVGDVYWLQRPSSMLSGWARSLWFKRSMGVEKVHFASNDFWQVLKSKHNIFTCSEENGTIVIHPLEETGR